MDQNELQRKKATLQMIAQKARNLLAQEFVANQCDMLDVVDVVACVSAAMLVECDIQMKHTAMEHIHGRFNDTMKVYMNLYKTDRSWITREGN